MCKVLLSLWMSPWCLIIVSDHFYSFHLFTQLLSCVRPEPNAQVWLLQMLRNDRLICMQHLPVTEVRQWASGRVLLQLSLPLGIQNPQSLHKIYAVSSVLISFHHHYFLFPTSSLVNSLSVKITDNPRPPSGSREPFQVHAIQPHI